MKNTEIRQKIDNLIEDHYYSTCSDCVLPNDSETDIYLEDAIEEMLERIGVCVITKFGVAIVLTVPAMNVAL